MLGVRWLALVALVCIPFFVLPAQAQKAGAWAAMPPMPTLRSELAAAASDGRIYVAGGLAEKGGLNTFEVFDIATRTWETLKQLPQRRHHTAMAAVDGRIYVTGGYMGSGSEGLRDLRVYEPETNQWRRRASPPRSRVAHSMAAIQGKLYVVGGITRDPHSVWSYDPLTNTWRDNLSRIPTMREHATAVAVSGKLYVIGGRWSQVNLSVVEVYDPRTNQWSRAASIPAPMGGLTSAVVNGRIHVTGGDDVKSTTPYAGHYAYNPRTDTWETLPSLPTARHGLTSVGVDGVFYVIGGSTVAGADTRNNLSNLVEAYRVE